MVETPAHQAFVQFHIFLRGVRPAVIASHAALLERVPHILVVLVVVDGTVDDIEHVIGVVVEEREAIAVAGVLVVGQHRVAQTARLADNRHCAVAQGNQLAQAARLELAGHKEHVAARVDLMRQRVVHREPRRDLALELALCPREQIDIAALAHAQHNQLHVLAHQVADDVVHKVKPLLAAQAADHADNRHIRVNGQTELFLQFRLALCLAGQVIRGIFRRNARVRRGIVVRHVDAIEHAEHFMLARAEQTIQPLTVVCRLNFLGIGRADGGDDVGIHQRSLHEVRAAVAFQLVVRPQAVAQTQHVLHFADAEHALILQIVDGEHGLDVREERQVGILNFQQCGHHAGLPVMRMNHVGLEVQQRQGVQRRAAEETKAFVLVAAHAVDIRTAEIELVVHKVELHAVLFQQFNAAVLTAPAQRDLEVGHMGHLVNILLRHRRIQGQHHAHVVTLLRQNRRQRADNIRQTAGLDKRDALARRKENFHRFYPPSEIFPAGGKGKNYGK